jgi:hypothetical protein
MRSGSDWAITQWQSRTIVCWRMDLYRLLVLLEWRWINADNSEIVSLLSANWSKQGKFAIYSIRFVVIVDSCLIGTGGATNSIVVSTWTTIITQKSSERRLKTSTIKDTPMKSRPVWPFLHSNKNPWRKTVAEENEDDCSCSTDAVTVKVSNVVSFHHPPAHPSVVLLPFMSDSLYRLLTSCLSLLAYHERCKELGNAW